MAAVDTIHRALEALNKHDSKGFAGTYAASTVVADPQYPEPLKGREAVQRDIEAFFVAFPDLQGRIRTLVSEGDTYAVEFEAAGTHKGPLSTPDGDVAPTGRRLTIGISSFGRVDGGGLVVDERRYYDLAGLFAQLGVSP